MPNPIHLTIRDRIATTEYPNRIVSNNSDYPIIIDFDEDWDVSGTKTLHVKYGCNQLISKIFTGAETTLPPIPMGGLIEIGVEAGNIKTTTGAILILSNSVTAGSIPNDLPDDRYAQIMERLDDIESGAVSDEKIQEAVDDYLTENPVSGEGVGIVSIEKTGSNANVDIYTITLSNGNTSTFTVTNALDESGLEAAVSSGYAGKGFSFLGDSITTFQGYITPGNLAYYTPYSPSVNSVDKTWWKQLIDALGGTLVVNNSYSATKVTTTNGATPTGTAMCGSRCENLNTDNKNPDVIIVFGGINDFNSSVQLGTYDGTGAFPTNTNTFREAYSVMLSKILTKYPAAEVWVCTLMHNERGGEYSSGFPEITGSNTLHEWNDAIRELADLFGCKVIDLANCGITHQNLSLYTEDYNSVSGYGLHPNADGHKLMAEWAIKQMTARSTAILNATSEQLEQIDQNAAAIKALQEALDELIANGGGGGSGGGDSGGDDDDEVEIIATSTLASGNAWYIRDGVETPATNITTINFTSDYSPTGNETESWNAGASDSDAIMCYVNGDALTVATTNGATGIYISNGENMFTPFKNVETISGTKMFVAKESGVSMQAACRDLNKLTTPIVIPDGVTSMYGTYNGCAALKSPGKLPDSITNMNYAYNNCSVMTELPNIPASATTMQYTFFKCSKAALPAGGITIPSTVIDIQYSFLDCTAMDGTITINAANLTSYQAAFKRNSTPNTRVHLTGTCPLLVELAATDPSRTVTVLSE